MEAKSMKEILKISDYLDIGMVCVEDSTWKKRSPVNEHCCWSDGWNGWFNSWKAGECTENWMCVRDSRSIVEFCVSLFIAQMNQLQSNNASVCRLLQGGREIACSTCQTNASEQKTVTCIDSIFLSVTGTRSDRSLRIFMFCEIKKCRSKSQLNKFQVWVRCLKDWQI